MVRDLARLPEHAPDALRGVGHHGVDQEGERLRELERVGDHLRGRRGIGLYELPRCVRLDQVVAVGRERHHRVDRVLELVRVHRLVDDGHGPLDLGEHVGARGHGGDPRELRVGEVEGPVDEVAEGVDELVVDPVGKGAPGEVQLARVARGRDEVIPEAVRREPEVEVVLVGPDHVPRDFENLWSSTLSMPEATTALGRPYPAPFSRAGQKMQWW